MKSLASTLLLSIVVCTVTPLCFSGSPVGISQDGLLLHLDATNPSSYPGTGNVWFDLSGNGNDFSVLGNSYDSSGFFGPNDMFKIFDGTSNNIDFGYGSDFVNGTMIAWTRVVSNNQAWMTLFRGYGTDIGSSPAAIDVYGDHHVIVRRSDMAVGMFNSPLGVPGGRSGFRPLSNDATLNDIPEVFSTFSMFTAVFTADGPGLEVFVNSTSIGSVGPDPDVGMQGGTRYLACTDTGAQAFGDVAAAYMYNRALSAAEIDDIYQSTLATLF